MDTLDYILTKIDILDYLGEEGKNPIEIPNVGRWDLTKWLYDLNMTLGVEVGVAAGEYSKDIMQNNPQMVLHGVDPWERYAGYRDYTREKTFNKLYEDAKSRLSRFKNYVFMRMFSTEAAKAFEDNSIDFVYIDANHQYKYVMEDMTAWYKKVRPGGILAGHDYARMKGWIEGKPIKGNWAVVEAVNDFTKQNKINPWFILGTNAKTPGMVRDDVRSWMIIKK